MSTARRQTVIDAITKNQDAYLKFVSEFIQQPSEAPKEGKAEVLDAQLWLANQLKSWGWEMWLDVWEASPGEPNLAVRIPGASGKPGLMFNGHADVVPVPSSQVKQWKYPPYSGRIVDGRMWGRGTSDMKGGVAAFLWAAKTLVEEGVELEDDLILTVNIGEESAKPEIGVKSVLERGYTAPLVINAEPSNLQIFRAAMGWFFFELTVPGKPTHPANRYMCVDPNIPLEERPGADAIDYLRQIMNGLDELNQGWSNKRFDLAPPQSMNMTPVHISGGSKSASMAESAQVTYAVVFHPGHTADELIEEIQGKIDEVVLNNEWLQKHEPVLRAPVLDPIWEPMHLDADHPGSMDLAKSVEFVTKKPVKFGSFPGPCDANVIAASGIDTLIFGPGDLSFGCHSVNEYVPIDHLMMASQVYADFMMRRCAPSGSE